MTKKVFLAIIIGAIGAILLMTAARNYFPTDEECERLSLELNLPCYGGTVEAGGYNDWCSCWTGPETGRSEYRKNHFPIPRFVLERYRN
jgi:hypothetical protein